MLNDKLCQHAVTQWRNDNITCDNAIYQLFSNVLFLKKFNYTHTAADCQKKPLSQKREKKIINIFP